MLNCRQIDVLLCDYAEGSLGQAERADVELHLASCPDCAQLAQDAQAALHFLAKVEDVEPPPELVNRILFEIPHPSARKASEPGRAGALDWLSGILRPVLQPRFAMGMAMTILSFSMIGRLAGVPQRPLAAADLNPVSIWQGIDVNMQRAWDRAVKYYENLRLVYEIQNRLQEWSVQEEQARAEEENKARRTVESAQPENDRRNHP